MGCIKTLSRSGLRKQGQSYTIDVSLFFWSKTRKEIVPGWVLSPISPRPAPGHVTASSGLAPATSQVTFVSGRVARNSRTAAAAGLTSPWPWSSLPCLLPCATRLPDRRLRDGNHLPCSGFSLGFPRPCRSVPPRCLLHRSARSA